MWELDSFHEVASDQVCCRSSLPYVSSPLRLRVEGPRTASFHLLIELFSAHRQNHFQDLQIGIVSLQSFDVVIRKQVGLIGELLAN